LLHVVPPPVIGYAEGMIIPDDAESVDEARTRLDEMQPKDPTLVVERRLAQGDPAGEIVWNAADIRADAIVIGTHGRSGLARLVMGSVAENVVRRASCPVVTIKKPLAESRANAAPVAAGAARE
jgi:nucleotide-binding universal stress UspA family protein